MGIQSCIDCGGQVSDRATACPHCGAPQRAPAQRETASATATPWDGQRVTTQQTGRLHKLHLLGGGTLLAIGVAGMLFGAGHPSGGPSVWSAWTAGIGAAWYLLAKFGAWYQHG